MCSLCADSPGDATAPGVGIVDIALAGQSWPEWGVGNRKSKIENRKWAESTQSDLVGALRHVS